MDKGNYWNKIKHKHDINQFIELLLRGEKTFMF